MPEKADIADCTQYIKMVPHTVSMTKNATQNPWLGNAQETLLQGETHDYAIDKVGTSTQSPRPKRRANQW